VAHSLIPVKKEEYFLSRGRSGWFNRSIPHGGKREVEEVVDSVKVCVFSLKSPLGVIVYLIESATTLFTPERRAEQGRIGQSRAGQDRAEQSR
jgi:hypothetical protein